MCGIQGIGPGKLIDNEQEPRAIVDNRITDQRLMVFYHCRDVAQMQGGVLFEGHLTEIGGRDNRRNVPDHQPLIGRIKVASRANHRSL